MFNERQSCHRECEQTFSTSFLACYGPPSACTERCQAEQASCQSRPLQELNACETDRENPRSCRAQLDAGREACRRDRDLRACEDGLRMRAFDCWQDCQRAEQPPLQSCGEAFKICLDRCAAG